MLHFSWHPLLLFQHTTSEKSTAARLTRYQHPALLAGEMAWISTYNFVLTIHLSFIRQDNLPPSARRIDGQGLLEALLNLRAPHSLSIIVCGLVCRVAHPLHVLGRALAAAPAAGINRGGWALQAGAWSRLGRNLEFPNTQHNKQLLSITEPGTFGSKTQHNAQFSQSAQCGPRAAKQAWSLPKILLI